MEALGHVFMYFLRGKLPWQGLKTSTKKKRYEAICKVKQQTKLKDLCKGYPGVTTCLVFGAPFCHVGSLLSVRVFGWVWLSLSCFVFVLLCVS